LLTALKGKGIVPQAAYCSSSDAAQHRQGWRTAYAAEVAHTRTLVCSPKP